MILHPVDIAIIAVYLATMVATGWWLSRHHRDTDQYFLGSRNFPGWAVGISFIGSTISSVTFIAYPADSFKTAWIRLVPNLAFPLVVTLAGLVFIPFFRGGVARSAYHYLGLRFGGSVAAYAATVYLLAQVVRATTITYLLSVLLASITGIDISACIAVAAGVTALYTVKGGFTAVVWTDVIQTVILLLGAAACIVVVAMAVPGGLDQVIAEAVAAGKISLRDLDPVSGQLVAVQGGWSLTEKTSLMLVLVGVAQYIAGQLDQDTVQRWCAARSDREAKKSMVVLGFGALPVWGLFMFLGSCLWVYYRHFPSELSQQILAGGRRAEDILPQFIISALPLGVTGLVISAALAAAMASLSSCINAAGMVWVNDIYRIHLARSRDDRHHLRVARLASMGMAGLMAVGAWLLHRTSASTVMEMSIILLALVGGGISGAFLFGIFTRMGDSRAVLAGIIVTLLFTAYASLMQFGVLPRTFSSYYTSVLGNTVMFLTCLLAAQIWPAPPRDLSGLTIWTRKFLPASERNIARRTISP